MQSSPDSEEREERNGNSPPVNIFGNTDNSGNSGNYTGNIRNNHFHDFTCAPDRRAENSSTRRIRSRSPAIGATEQAAVTAALLQSATALPKAIDAKRTVHLSAFAVARIAHDIYARNVAKALPLLAVPAFPTIANSSGEAPTKAHTRASTMASAKASTEASAKTPGKAPARASTKTPAKAPAGAQAKTPAKAPTRASAKTPAKAPARALAKTPAKAHRRT